MPLCVFIAILHFFHFIFTLLSMLFSHLFAVCFFLYHVCTYENFHPSAIFAVRSQEKSKKKAKQLQTNEHKAKQKGKQKTETKTNTQAPLCCICFVFFSALCSLFVCFIFAVIALCLLFAFAFVMHVHLILFCSFSALFTQQTYLMVGHIWLPLLNTTLVSATRNT